MQSLILKKLISKILYGSSEYKKTHFDLLSLLYENGFILDSSTNEMELLENRYDQSKNNRVTFTMQIATTLQCNFRCPYCYEEHESIFISEETQQSIVKFIEKNITKWKQLCIAWFGGEPLLRPKIINNISKKIIDICNKNNVEYYGFITTNGYLLNEKNSSILSDSKVKEAQITLDGNRDTHDQRRFLVSGKGTYNSIVSNIINNTDFLERIILRVNVDSQSSKDMDGILETLLPLKEKTIIGFMPVQETNNYCTKTESSIDFSNKVGDLNRKAKEKGFIVTPGHRLPGSTYCGAYSDSYLLVDAHGDIHKCVVMVGKRNFRQGYILPNGDIHNEKNLLKQWNFNPFEDKECVNCKFLPICMGGCQNMSIEKKLESGRCSIKQNFEQNIISLLKTKQKDNIVGRAAYG